MTAASSMHTSRFSGAGAALGPLVVSAANRRYFAIAGDSRQVVYLTGSHIWNNFHDGLGPGRNCTPTPERNDYDAYLQFLVDHDHNFIRLWRWEHFRSQAAGGAFHLCMTPQPWRRGGPGTASDGQPRFDLARFDQAYFDRLRERVIAAGTRRIYVGVMLFEGWALHLSPMPDNVEGHPFHAANNINGISISSIVDYQVLPLDARIQALQEAYVRKVVDTVQDLPNVLYEVANESSGDTADGVHLPDGPSIPTPIGDSTDWQYWIITFLKQYERQMGYTQHPIGMTMQYPVPEQSKVNDVLFNSPADWISPGFDDVILGQPGVNPSTGRWYNDPPPSDGTKVVISDTDHFAPGAGDALWPWKAFLRGHHPILMDFGIIDVKNPLDPSLGVPPYAAFEACRYAMGDTWRFARRLQLVDLEPRADLTSTAFALANPGQTYLVLQPAAGPFTVRLHAAMYTVEWHSLEDRQTRAGGTIEVAANGPRTFTSPFSAAGPCVLYLQHAEHR